MKLKSAFWIVTLSLAVISLTFNLLKLSAQENENSNEGIVYHFEIKSNIDPRALRITQKAYQEAKSLGADVILIELNTYGGTLIEADSISNLIMRESMPSIAFINTNAASAGALISISADRIYMARGSTIGAATVVNQSGEVLPDKYQSYMRGLMRGVAEENNRDPRIAEGMVDENIEIEGVSEKGQVITFTRSEAIEHGFCEGRAESVREVLEAEGLENYKIIKHQLTTVDRMIDFLINPAVSGILILLILGGLYFELQTPGVGFPILIAVLASVLYFAPLYLEQLASAWEISFFIIGIILIGVEIFVLPGFGVAGILGLGLIVSGLALAMVRNDLFDFTMAGGPAVFEAFATVLISFVIAFIMVIFTGGKLIKTDMFKRLVLADTLKTDNNYEALSDKRDTLEQKVGETLTRLNPSGKVLIDEEVYDAISDGPYIEKGKKVKVLQDLRIKVIVRPIN